MHNVNLRQCDSRCGVVAKPAPSAGFAGGRRPVSPRHSDRSSAAARPACRPAAASNPSHRSPRSQHVSASRASEVLSEHLLQRRGVQHRLRSSFLSLRFSSSRAFSLRAPEISKSPDIQFRWAGTIAAPGAAIDSQSACRIYTAGAEVSDGRSRAQDF